MGQHSTELPKDWYLVLFPNVDEVDENESPLKFQPTVRDKRLAVVRLLPKGWATQVENQGNYKLGNSVDQSCTGMCILLHRINFT